MLENKKSNLDVFLEDIKNTQSCLPKDTDLYIGKGFALDDIKKEKFVDIVQGSVNRNGHTMVYGSTRVGKTRLEENGVIQDIKAGRNVVVIDPKVDEELLSSIVSAAVEAGRMNDFMLFSIVHTDHSIKLNPLANFWLPDEVISHVMSGVPVEDEFFYNYALELTTVIVYSLLKIKKMNDKKESLTFDEIAQYVSLSKIEELRDFMEIYGDRDSVRILTLIESVLASGGEYFSKVSSTLRTTLSQLTIGGLSKVIGDEDKNEFLDRIEADKGAILFVQTGAMLQSKASLIISKIVVSMIQSAVGRKYVAGKKFQRKLCLWIDEFSNCCYLGIEDMFNKAGGSNCAIVGLTQSPSDIVVAIGADRAVKVEDSTNTKIFMRTNSTDSASTFKIYSGTQKRTTTQLQLNGGIRSTEMEENVLEETDFFELKPREFYYFGFEGKFKGKTARTVEPKYKVKLPPSSV